MTASDLIRELYDAINRRDLAVAIATIDENCTYEDFNFPKAFIGQAAVKQLFIDSFDNIPDGLQFVIDDITQGDPVAVGLIWHVELDGIPFPNGRGASFYRLSEVTGKIIQARDVVEPPIKPGKVAFSIIRLASPLVRRLLKSNPDLQSNATLGLVSDKRNIPLALCLGILTIAYLFLLLLSPPGWLPGDPIWAIHPETLQTLLNESINFFFVLPLLNSLGFSLIQAPTVHPVSQAFFNFAIAWMFMFLPLLLMDPRGERLPRVGIWSLAMFLTNVFLMPYMALRLLQPTPPVPQSVVKGRLARLFGAIGLWVGGLAIIWFGWNRPALGDLPDRFAYLTQQIMTDRATLAFCVDLTLFWIFQAWLMGAVIAKPTTDRWLRFIPFLGLGTWLIR